MKDPKQAAIDLVSKLLSHCSHWPNGEYEVQKGHAKACAIIAVDEIMKVVPWVSKENCDTVEQIRAYDWQFSEYWEEVKKQIELL